MAFVVAVGRFLFVSFLMRWDREPSQVSSNSSMQRLVLYRRFEFFAVWLYICVKTARQPNDRHAACPGFFPLHMCSRLSPNKRIKSGFSAG